MDERQKQLLMDLSRSMGVSGQEGETFDLLQKAVSPYGQTQTDGLGNLLVTLKPVQKNGIHLLIDAHMDEVGFVLTHVDAHGFVKFAPCGGIDRRMMQGQQMTILGRERVDAVVCSTPPHLSKDEKGALPAVEELFADTGLGKTAKEVLSVGDYALLKVQPQKLLNGYVTGKALDDRAGCMALCLLCEQIAKMDVDFGVSVLFSCQEEIGEQGARVAAFGIAPTHAIVVDVSFGRVPGDKEYQTGRMKGGPMIGFAPVLNKQMAQSLVRMAEQNRIP